MNTVVTGSSGVLAQSYLDFLSQEHVRNVYGMDRERPKLVGHYEFIQCDLTDEDEVNKAASSILSSVEGALSLVNFAGRISNSPVFRLDGTRVISLTTLDWEKDFSDVLYPAWVPTLCFASMCAKFGVPLNILQISSISSRGVAGQSAYSAAKAALEVASKSLARELGAMGVRVNTLRIGYTETPGFKDNVSEEKQAQYKSRLGLGRFLQPEEVALAIQGIQRNSYMSGSVVDLDGAFD